MPLDEAAPPSPLPETPPPRFADDNMESIHEQCKSPMHVVKEWIPFCEEELKPKQDLEFSNFKECEKFYKSYAHHVGFSVRKSSFKKGKEGVKNYRQIAGRDPEKLILVGKRIQNVLKELKELDGGASKSKMSELESYIGSSAPKQIDILPPKHCHTKGSGVSVLKEGKKKQSSNNKNEREFVKPVENKAIIIVITVL
ncbi:hypothetical protein Cgig2_031342 [Carnegiea gigantea]|uniref:Uncharacterized protein n=1 Tax=Carnegiea gigantea TaxID=171969 RepID=A0A9Q1K873_9CARY|nr:hypothetical protein Cgig2_031342 [Carnegiea gigantea]